MYDANPVKERAGPWVAVAEYSTYLSADYTQALTDHGVLALVTTAGDAYDCDDAQAAMSV